jgi:hypothetical protein
MTWVPYVAVAAGATLLLKAVLVIGTEDADTPITPLLYLAGLLLALAAAIGFGLSRRRHRALIAIGSSLLVVLWVMGIGDLLTPVFEAIKDEEYVGDEGPIALLGLILLALGVLGSQRRVAPAQSAQDVGV